MIENFFWGAAVISIVVVSWFFYRYVVPKSWREWAGAGVVQAFVIAFYAEMYGFPVTIYFLARVFNLDIAGNFWDGNLWVYLTGEPAAMFVSMGIGYTIAFFGVTLLTAGWREAYRANKQKRLAAGGLYTVVRHPQYTGIFLALFGEGVVHWPTIFSLAGAKRGAADDGKVRGRIYAVPKPRADVRAAVERLAKAFRQSPIFGK